MLQPNEYQKDRYVDPAGTGKTERSELVNTLKKH